MLVSNLSIVCLDFVGMTKTCGEYWYLVQSHTMAHTAFRTRESLLWWLALRGLHVDPDMIPEYEFAYVPIRGEYLMTYCLEVPALDADTIRFKTLHNGRYTDACADRRNGIVHIRIKHSNEWPGHPDAQHFALDALYHGGRMQCTLSTR